MTALNLTGNAYKMADEAYFVDVESWNDFHEESEYTRYEFVTLAEALAFANVTKGAWKPQRIADLSYA